MINKLARQVQPSHMIIATLKWSGFQRTFDPGILQLCNIAAEFNLQMWSLRKPELIQFADHSLQNAEPAARTAAMAARSTSSQAGIKASAGRATAPP